MKPLVNREDGHLIVAAVRVLRHTLKHPPTVDDVAGLLGLSKEWVAVNVGSLVNEGILSSIESAFVARLDVKDHPALDRLPAAAENTGIDDEIREFSEHRREEEETLGRLFSEGDAFREKAEKFGRMASDLKGFKPRPPKTSSLFKDPPPEDE